MEQNGPIDDLAHIRSLMERSTRFLSLSGLSGVFAGIVALGGAWLAQHHMGAFEGTRADTLTYGTVRDALFDRDALLVLLVEDAVGVLMLALIGAFWFTWRRSRRSGQGLRDASAWRLMINLLVPLVAGGVFCLALLYYGLPGLVAPATLVFYGLALLNAGKYTLDEIRWLGLSELVLGSIALFWLGAGLMFWSLGFGVLHIVYGGLMWYRHERGMIDRLNKAFESRVRLGIMAVLVVNDWVDHGTLRDLLKVTDGNLASHVAALIDGKYVQVRKRFVGNRPNTAFKATATGAKAFRDHLNAMDRLLKKDLRQ